MDSLEVLAELASQSAPAPPVSTSAILDPSHQFQPEDMGFPHPYPADPYGDTEAQAQIAQSRPPMDPYYDSGPQGDPTEAQQMYYNPPQQDPEPEPAILVNGNRRKQRKPKAVCGSCDHKINPTESEDAMLICPIALAIFGGVWISTKFLQGIGLVQIVEGAKLANRVARIGSYCVTLVIWTKRPTSKNGRSKPHPVADNSELDAEREPVTPKNRTRTSPKKSARAMATQDIDVSASIRPSKRKRVDAVSSRPTRLTLKLPNKGKGKEREEEEQNIFEDILTAQESDLRKTTPSQTDRDRFRESSTRAEKKLQPPPPPVPDAFDDTAPGPSSRPLRSSLAHTHTPIPHASSSPPPTNAKVPPKLRIHTINIGGYDIKTWYDAPYPEEYTNPEGTMWICEFCLKYMKSKFGYVRHRLYCQNLCLLSKMFLDHKSLFYDVEPFLFYVVTQLDDEGSRFVGYFSKEKMSPKNYNLSCIMTLPTFQRQGWGNFLMDFSYLLSKKEKRLGSPEKPLSALGKLGYQNYWKLSIMRYLDTSPKEPRLEDITSATAMTEEDVYNTLEDLSMIEVFEMPKPIVKPSPGQAIKTVKGRKAAGRRNVHRPIPEKKKIGHDEEQPYQTPVRYMIKWDPKQVDQHIGHWESKSSSWLKVKPEKLRWSPYIMSQTAKVLEEETRKPTAVLGPVVTLETQVEETTADAGAKSLFDDDNVTPAGLVDQAERQDHSLSNGSSASIALRMNGTSTPIPTAQTLETVLEQPVSLQNSHRLRIDRSTLSPTPTQKKRATRASNRFKEQTDAHSDPAHSDTPNPPAETYAFNLSHVMDFAHGANEEAVQIVLRRGRGRPPKRKITEGDEEMAVETAAYEPRQLRSAGSRREVERIPKRMRVEMYDVSPDAGDGTAESSTGHEDDVKFEDVGTPSLTSLTSRHSVPSDDTLNGVVQTKEQQLEEEQDADGEYDDEIEDMVGGSKQRDEPCTQTDPNRTENQSRMSSQNDGPPMQYIAPSDSRRDVGLDAPTPFSHQSLGQALGNHLGPPTAYHRPPDYRQSPTPSPIHPHHAHVQQQQQQQQQHVHAHPNGAPSSSSSYASSASPQMSLKRKLVDGNIAMQKRRRDVEDTVVDGYDGGQGAKHWTDDEKTKLFNWLMGPGQDEHWNSLRATKNSCLREVFGSKKTYQALKGCYERNFNLFKQIYAFESWAHQLGSNVSSSGMSEADRLKEYERRLQGAKKAGCDVGNITARTIDHWHRAGWYQLFYTRWHGDPATTKPSSQRNGMSSHAGGDDIDVDLSDGGGGGVNLDFESNLTALSNSHEPLSFVASQQPAPPPPPPHPIPQPTPSHHHYLQIQTQTSKMKLDYLRRREEREEKESLQRLEIERLRNQRQQAEQDHNKQLTNQKHKADRAIALLENPNIDPSVKAAAGEYLKKAFMD
ncbi:hypothetical protein BDZ89DRAFT_1033648 [Hymenopellis radicata]|nr:hypothetical protein BDZ89DRAFT_1033648 [Hymenopellis radicata]